MKNFIFKLEHMLYQTFLRLWCEPQETLFSITPIYIFMWFLSHFIKTLYFFCLFILFWTSYSHFIPFVTYFPLLFGKLQFSQNLKDHVMWENKKNKSSNNEDNNCIMQKLRIFSIAYSFMKNFFGFHLLLSEEIDFLLFLF
jgi:hypothetical protein